MKHKYIDYDFSKFEAMALKEMESKDVIKRLAELHGIGIDKLQEAIKLKQDLCKSIASHVYSVDYEKVTNAQRTDVKFLNYHIMYGRWCS